MTEEREGVERILICGGREFADYDYLSKEVSKHRPKLIIHGGAKGADALAGRYADTWGIPCMSFPAPWFYHDKSAGPIRNGWMLRFGTPSIILAFPGGRGTANMIEQAQNVGLPVIQLDPNQEEAS